MKHIVIFREWKCYLYFSQYSNGQLAIELYDINDDSPVATATVNIPEINSLEPNDVIIKEYSESQGMTQALIDAGIISHKFIGMPYGPFDSKVNICTLIVEPKNK